MTINVINYANKFCEIYGNSVINNDEFLGNIIIRKTNKLLLSAEEDMEKIKLKKDNLSEEEVIDIIQILTKLSFISRVNLIKCTNDIKRRDFSHSSEIKNSKHIIDYILKNIAKILIESNKDIDIYNVKNFFYNDIISHTNRVFFTIIKFIKYYNHSINNNIVYDIKKNFKKRYSKYYKSVLKKFNIKKSANKLEDVYKYGLRELFVKEISDIAIAAFWHDIANISLNLLTEHYSNLEDGYYASKGYSYLKYFINYSDHIPFIVGLHNEYFGYGNGVFLDYYNTINNSKSIQKLDYIVSFDYNDILSLDSISYFPSKILEIVDLFDNVIYKYNQSNCNEALKYIREDYLYKEVKIDPIIFDIFSSFIYNENKLIA